MSFGCDLGFNDADLLSVGARDLRGVVQAAIADNQDFKLSRPVAAKQSVETPANDRGLVVSGDDDRDQASIPLLDRTARLGVGKTDAYRLQLTR